VSTSIRTPTSFFGNRNLSEVDILWCMQAFVILVLIILTKSSRFTWTRDTIPYEYVNDKIMCVLIAFVRVLLHLVFHVSVQSTGQLSCWLFLDLMCSVCLDFSINDMCTYQFRPLVLLSLFLLSPSSSLTPPPLSRTLLRYVHDYVTPVSSITTSVPNCPNNIR